MQECVEALALSDVRRAQGGVVLAAGDAVGLVGGQGGVEDAQGAAVGGFGLGDAAGIGVEDSLVGDGLGSA